MELGFDDQLLSENPLSSPLFFPDNDINNYADKPFSGKDDYPVESVPSTEAFFQDFQHIDDNHQFHVPGSSPNTIFEVQTGSNFDPSDVFPYGSSANIDFYEYECKPFADSNNNNNNNICVNNHGQVMDNFQAYSGSETGGYLNLPQTNPIDFMGSVPGQVEWNLQETKSMNFVIPDEVSSISASNNYDYYKIFDINNNKVLPSSARKTNEGHKKNNVTKGQWTAKEDRLLVELVEQHGEKKWSLIAQRLPERIGKQCRERWLNHLRPNIKKDTWSEEEDMVLIETHEKVGNKWAEIAKKLPGRTENSIKNHWNATKRRQYSRRKWRSSRNPGGSRLQDYITSLNLKPSVSTGRHKPKTSPPAMATATDAAIQPQQAPPPADYSFYYYDQLVPIFDDYNEVPDNDLDIDDKLFHDACNLHALLEDDAPSAPIVVDDDDEKSLAMALAVEDDGGMNPLGVEDRVAKMELDLLELISQTNNQSP